MRVEEAVPPLLKTRLVWLRDDVTPPGDESARETVPEKPLILVSVIVDVPETPINTVCDIGLADIENSVTLTVMFVE